MIAALILTVSLAALLQFFISYSHALVTESRGYQLSEEGREVAGFTAPGFHKDHLGTNDFQRLIELIALCPPDGTDQQRVRTVSAYFSLLGCFRGLFSRLRPAAAAWIDSERSGCAYFAAMILDRRIAHSRVLLAQQTSRF